MAITTIPTSILMEEHRVIEQVLNCLEIMAKRAKKEQTLSADDARAAITFFRNFADRCHHGKEEDHLFVMMEERGFPRDGGPTGQMLHEHELGRKFIGGMEAAIDSAAGGEDGGIEQFVANARDYVGLLRDHIAKEDHCLFTMADNAFSEADQKELMERFTKTEHEDMGTGAHQKFLAIANNLADKYGVEKVELSEAGGCGCNCNHHH